VNNKENYFELILMGLRARCHVDFSLYRKSTIKRRLSRRMAATNSGDYRAYFFALERDPHEWARLLKDLTIKFSHFFRDRPVFELLSDLIIPEIINEKEDQNDNTLRIWCTGCCFGEEVYSVAITLAEYFNSQGKNLDDYHISIFGTDVDEEALKGARLGVYGAEALKGVEKEILYRYFSLLRAKRLTGPKRLLYNQYNYQVIEPIRKMANFSKHDITSETRRSPPAGVVANYDLILCRNLLIYFSEPLQKKAFSNLVNSLNPGGYLILGGSESIPNEFQSYLIQKNRRHRVFKRKLSC